MKHPPGSIFSVQQKTSDASRCRHQHCREHDFFLIEFIFRSHFYFVSVLGLSRFCLFFFCLYRSVTLKAKDSRKKIHRVIQHGIQECKQAEKPDSHHQCILSFQKVSRQFHHCHEIDDRPSAVRQQFYASTAPALAGANGRYIEMDYQETQYYGDAILMMKKQWDAFSLNAALGASINDKTVNSTRYDSKTLR